MANARSELRQRHGGHLVGHKTAWTSEAIVCVGLNLDPEQWSFRGVGGKGTDGHRGRGVKPVILQDYNRTRLTRVVAATSHGPDLPALHSVSEMRSEMASTKFW